MKTIDVTITSQGQITIPAEIRRTLGLSKPGKAQFIVGDATVELRAPAMTLEEFLGTVPGRPGTSDDFDEEIEAAMFEATRHLGPDGQR